MFIWRKVIHVPASPHLKKRTAGMERMEIEALSVKDSANAISFFCQTKFNLPKKTIQMMAISAWLNSNMVL